VNVARVGKHCLYRQGTAPTLASDVGAAATALGVAHVRPGARSTSRRLVRYPLVF